MFDSISPFKQRKYNLLKLNLFQLFSKRYGIGYGLSKWICKCVGLHPFLRTFKILNKQYNGKYSHAYILVRVKEFLILNKDNLDYPIKKFFIDRIALMKSLRIFRGRRHSDTLPVRGQRCRTNARTNKNKNPHFKSGKQQKQFSNKNK